ncbi:MAG TPA: L-threonylcarbamoyladenylate synthase, partial [Rhodanobacteraceae bacterium]|nr:L-threonylcarbamoyladenylate synthase [Rhodanobacteraceae bacterium]
MMHRFGPGQIEAAAELLRGGGVLAYPTEAVFGLGCDPDNRVAFDRIFTLKRRPSEQGVLLVACDFSQIADWIVAPPEAIERARATWPGPYTWVFPRSDRVPEWIAGGHAGIALRVTAHGEVAALCRAFGGPIVSTSANLHGRPPAGTAGECEAMFGSALDGILLGETG